jgi:[ribosomal protein S5]-alanine N-acetyltransferase
VARPWFRLLAGAAGGRAGRVRRSDADREGSGVDPDEIELGVVVHPDHWGQGIAAEAGLAVATDCFRRVGLERVYAGVEPTNDNSLRVLAKVPGVRQVEGELYELTAAAFLG